MKDIYCSYYTNSEDITFYMASKLHISENDIVLEPSAGEGIFIDELLKKDAKIHIDALDINDVAISVLKTKYENNASVNVRKTDTLFDNQLDQYDMSQLWLKQTDTLLDNQLDFFNSTGGHYTKVIGNPPYGAWQDYDRRELLKKKYSGQYVKETYSLFLMRCISVLKSGGKLSFIIPDTFLYVNMHTKLREILLTKTKIDEILIFPSKFFPGISFGYSNLCIITLERCDNIDVKENIIKIYKGFKNSDEFRKVLTNEKLPEYVKLYKQRQNDILLNPQHRFIFADNGLISLVNKSSVHIGDVANVVTGFYTGDNIRFIRAKSKDVKGAKNYEVINSALIYNCVSNEGIPEIEEGYIPFIKSASDRRYIRNKDEWFVRWDCDTVSFYNKDKKARFQNSDFYFKTGIGIPMVKSQVVKAFLMSDRVFDQSIVGIFPNDESKLKYILALMNSSIINQLIHIINPTANNSANYIKLLPYKEPSKPVLSKIDSLVDKITLAIDKECYSEMDNLHKELDKIITDIFFEE